MTAGFGSEPAGSGRELALIQTRIGPVARSAANNACDTPKKESYLTTENQVLRKSTCLQQSVVPSAAKHFARIGKSRPLLYYRSEENQSKLLIASL
jgi:hypothetical protein